VSICDGEPNGGKHKIRWFSMIHRVTCVRRAAKFATLL
jgi:hypothetical protein